MRYPRNLFAVANGDLPPGLTRDDIGQIRAGDKLVCAVTGIVHTRYLIPHPIPDGPDPDKEPDIIFVSGHWYEEVAGHAKKRGIRYARKFASKSLGGVLDKIGAFIGDVLGKALT